MEWILWLLALGWAWIITSQILTARDAARHAERLAADILARQTEHMAQIVDTVERRSRAIEQRIDEAERWHDQHLQAAEDRLRENRVRRLTTPQT